jgi:hypothetical protein
VFPLIGASPVWTPRRWAVVGSHQLGGHSDFLPVRWPQLNASILSIQSRPHLGSDLGGCTHRGSWQCLNGFLLMISGWSLGLWRRSLWTKGVWPGVAYCAGFFLSLGWCKGSIVRHCWFHDFWGVKIFTSLSKISLLLWLRFDWILLLFSLPPLFVIEDMRKV